jgi:flagellar hook-associated protein 1 FlgK
MGLSTTLSNALSGLSVTDSALDVVSRNVSNSGTPGYHKQTISSVDMLGVSSDSARTSALNRAFSQSLQNYYTTETSDSAEASINASYLNQLQVYLGKPGDPGSLDTLYNTFLGDVSTLTATPDDFSVRATTVNDAQQLTTQLNHLTGSIQDLRSQANGQILSDVNNVNQALQSLVKINKKLGDLDTDPASRSALLDQRDRLVAQVASAVDVNVTYRSDDSVALATRSGVTLLDQKASVLSFDAVSSIQPSSQYSPDPDKNGVGTLTITTPAGYVVDVVNQNVLQSGEIKGLLDLRDKTLVQAQDHLDNIASSLAQATSTNVVQGTDATFTSPAQGMTVDTSGVLDGNDVLLNYTSGGVEKHVKVVNIADQSKLPFASYVDSNGYTVLGADFSAASGQANSLGAVLTGALPAGFQVSSTPGGTLTVRNDGTAGTKINALSAEITRGDAQSATPGQYLGLSLFVDGTAATPFTNSLSGQGQKLGFAGRITVNADVVADNSLLVQDSPTTPIGDVERANYLFNQLNDKSFSFPSSNPPLGSLNGAVTDIISQALDFQGGQVQSAQSEDETHTNALNALTGQMEVEYGVDVNDEMAKLVQLQAAYSANARVVTVAQNLVDTLMQSFNI